MAEQWIKPCPKCKLNTFKDGGCNYMKCSDSEPKSDCDCEWCWVCELPKFRPIPGLENKGACNDPSHNSHS